MYVSAFMDGNEEIESLQERITGRYLCENIVDKDGNVLEWGIDYKVSYENNEEFSTDGKKAKVIVEGIIDYSGKLEKEFNIKKAPRELTGISVVDGKS